MAFGRQSAPRSFSECLSKPSACSKFKTAEAVDQTGYYPTVSCVRYDAERDAYNVSLEEFVLRERSDPKPPAAAPKSPDHHPEIRDGESRGRGVRTKESANYHHIPI